LERSALSQWSCRLGKDRHFPANLGFPVKHSDNQQIRSITVIGGLLPFTDFA
jgi:hypothetical protein